jgi:hypothetical protein
MPDEPTGSPSANVACSPLLRARAMRMLIGLRNMHKTFMIVIGLALVVPSVARAQGNWLQKGVSGVGAEVGVAHQDGDTELLVTGAYSHQGFLDILLTLGWHDAAITGLPDLSVYSLSGELDYHPLKQTKEVPLSLKVGIAYAQTFFSSETLSENDLSLSAWETVLGAGVYRFFPLAERIGVTPQITAGWVHESASATSFGETQTNTDDRFALGVMASFAYLDSAGHIWGLTPSLGFGPGNTPTTFSFSVAFISTLLGAR